ncbi:MAG: signal peptidase II [Leptospiraceae bacterium]|nr:signal peptidase II [Leptospiraceae bacterium]
MNKAKMLFIGVILISLGTAQLMDYLVYLHIPENTALELFSFLELRHIRNHGGVFGIMQGNGWIFTGFAIVAMLVLIGYMLYAPTMAYYKYVLYALIAGGAISNILDRFIYGSVIDYINVMGIPYWHYIFNTADSLIHIGLWPLIIMSFVEDYRHKKTGKSPG